MLVARSRLCAAAIARASQTVALAAAMKTVLATDVGLAARYMPLLIEMGAFGLLCPRAGSRTLEGLVAA